MLGLLLPRARKSLSLSYLPRLCLDRSLASTAGHNLKFAFSYCVDQVKTFDYDNYVWLLQLPKELLSLTLHGALVATPCGPCTAAIYFLQRLPFGCTASCYFEKELRAAVFALRAFNIETGLVGEHVHESNLIPVRMQWWRDAVNSMYGERRPVPHPVVSALSQVNSLHPLTRYRLLRIISTRADDLMRQQDIQTVKELEDYAEGTVSQLLYLQLEAAQVSNAEADHAASHLGKAVGLATLLRGTAHLAQRRRCYLPAALKQQNHLQDEDLYAGIASAALSNVVFDVASLAKGHLDEARAMSAAIPREARSLMLSSVACSLYLDALQKQDFNVYAPSLHSGGYTKFSHQLQVKWKHTLGQY